jgi:hypothetical protein
VHAVKLFRVPLTVVLLLGVAVPRSAFWVRSTRGQAAA